MRRQYQNNYPYFITTNTVKMSYGLFEDLECAIIAATVIRTVTALYECTLYGYAIMPNHIHILIQTNTDTHTISQTLNSMKSMIYKNIRDKKKIPSALWQKSFYDTTKSTKQLFNTAIEYMKQNPQKWELPKIYKAYPYQYYSSSDIKERLKLFI